MRETGVGGRLVWRLHPGGPVPILPMSQFPATWPGPSLLPPPGWCTAFSPSAARWQQSPTDPTLGGPALGTGGLTTHPGGSPGPEPGCRDLAARRRAGVPTPASCPHPGQFTIQCSRKPFLLRARLGVGDQNAHGIGHGIRIQCQGDPDCGTEAWGERA